MGFVLKSKQNVFFFFVFFKRYLLGFRVQHYSTKCKTSNTTMLQNKHTILCSKLVPLAESLTLFACFSVFCILSTAWGCSSGPHLEGNEMIGNSAKRFSCYITHQWITDLWYAINELLIYDM